MPRLILRRALARAATIALAVVGTTCNNTPTGPGSITDFAIHSVTPSSGPATGGTEVTIRGVGFATGTAITIGGRPATDLIVRGSDSVSAKTPASTVAGPVDVAVALNGRTHVLENGFRYETLPPNSAPVIRTITAQGTRPRQPAAFADYGETIQVSLSVVDAESAPAQLLYQWQPCDGVIIGTGPQVEWRAPVGGSLPSTCTIRVTVTDGPHVLTTSISIRLHNSIAEVGALAREFLTEFANSAIPAVTTVRNFSDSCPGKLDELQQVAVNRRDYNIISALYGDARVTVAFGGMCKTKTADACVTTPAEWRSTHKPTQQLEIATGISTISGVYRDSRWWLCDSLFDGPSTLGFWSMR